ncbi:MAG: hypothetical protein JWL72_1270 [Ilumatobacteraceae bacterium]|nr:hypothetical protein [Ilumatobacteraceae bacterium]
MKPTPESERRLRAALDWAAEQMPATSEALGPQRPAAPDRRRIVLSLALVAAIVGVLLAVSGVLPSTTVRTETDVPLASNLSVPAPPATDQSSPTNSSVQPVPPTDTVAPSTAPSEVSTAPPSAKSYATFQADLQASKAIIGDLSIGDSCDKGDGTFQTDLNSPQPVLVAVAENLPDGTCVVKGWSYYGGQPDDVPRDPITGEKISGVAVFDDSGNVLSWTRPTFGEP